MSQQTINVGTSPNDGTGTPLRTAFQYTNSNFSELYTAVGPSGNNIVVPGSATITGDLTVDTNTLKVDSTNNLVGIGRTPSGYTLDITTGGNGLRIERSGVEMGGFIASGNPFWGSLTNHPFILMANGSEKARLDSSGNLGLGVTPSAWVASGGPTLQLGGANGAIAANAQYLNITSNAYYSSGYKYIGTGNAASYAQEASKHVWYTAPSGTAGNAITFTQAMTLDASGNLLVGATSAIGKMRVRNGSGQNFVVDVSTANQVSLQNYGSTGDGGYQELNLWGSPVTITTGAAGGTSGTERIRVKSGGQMRFVPLAADPSGAEAGDVYYNSTSNKLKCYNGTTWNDLF